MLDFALAALGVLAIVASLAILALAVLVVIIIQGMLAEKKDETEGKEAVARLNALAARLEGQKDRVVQATADITEIEPTEGATNA